MLAGAVTDAAIEGFENQTCRVEELQNELAAEQIAHGETRAERAELRTAMAAAAQETAVAATKAPDHTNTPPSETPAETAPKKKGAAGTTKG